MGVIGLDYINLRCLDYIVHFSNATMITTSFRNLGSKFVTIEVDLRSQSMHLKTKIEPLAEITSLTETINL